jgi:DNA adenine methylase
MLRAAKSSATAAPDAEQRPARPFLKWVGGKAQLLDQMEPLLPEVFGRYFEPFVGGAALFFELRTRSAEMPAVLSDVNDELVDCYCAIRDEVEDVIRELKAHRYESTYYYQVRDWDRRRLSRAKAAARTIFLNKTGYNGLYRVNRAGQFNVPFGRFTNPRFRDEDNLRACSRALEGVSIERRDYSLVLGHAKKGDFVYFDPPYVPLSPTSDFTSYIPGGFGEVEQRNLAKTFAKLAKRGVHVMLSNSDTPLVRRLYEGFAIDVVYAARHVNSNAARRGKLAEVVVRSYGASP